jgi:hypothetical protein
MFLLQWYDVREIGLVPFYKSIEQSCLTIELNAPAIALLRHVINIRASRRGASRNKTRWQLFTDTKIKNTNDFIRQH